MLRSADCPVWFTVEELEQLRRLVQGAASPLRERLEDIDRAITTYRYMKRLHPVHPTVAPGPYRPDPHGHGA